MIDLIPWNGKFAQKWGVTLDNRLAIDPSGAGVGLGPAVPLVTAYGDHPITKEFGNGISFYQGAPIETSPVAGVQVTPLLLASWVGRFE